MDWKLILGVLAAVAGCAPSTTLDAALPDGGLGDAGMALADVFVADAPLSDAPGLDSWGADAPVPVADDAAGPDSPEPLVPEDAVVSDLCGNGYIDPGEVCDPGVFVDGGVVVGRTACVSSCTVHDCALAGGGVLEPVSNRCIQRVRGDLVDPSSSRWGRSDLVYWESVAEREQIFTALTSALAPGEFTGGQISLRRFGGTTGTWYFYRPDGTSLDATGLLPDWMERFPIPDPSSCALLTLRPGAAAMLGQSTCSSSLPSTLLVFVDPPGRRR